MTDNGVAIEIHDLTVAYGTKPVLWNVDVSLPRAQLIAIVGPNGAGKSSLLRAMLGLISPTSGFVRVHQKGTSAETLGYVPQRETVDWDFPVTVNDVVLMGRYGKLGWLKRPKKQDKEMALHCLREVNMEAFASRHISQLSGGQQQRVFLARALAQEATIYLMDEPFAGVDAVTEQSIIETLRKLRSQGRTIIVVHHDLQTVKDYFDWVVMLNMHIIAAGAVHSALTAENLQRTYGGRLTILDQVAEAVRTETPRVDQDTNTGIS
jgi:manganese/zinc/iron transport system ATP- binding protein